MADAARGHVLLLLLLHGAADLRLRHPRHPEGVRPLERDARLGLDLAAVVLCRRAGHQRQPGRQVRRTPRDDRRRHPLVRRQLGRELRGRLQEPGDPVGHQRLLPGPGLGAGQPAAVELVGRGRTRQGLRLLRVRRRLRLGAVVRDLDHRRQRAAPGLALDLPAPRAADAGGRHRLLPDRP
ncbi:hypothetical protein D9M68_722980 [compost metagenome]